MKQLIAVLLVCVALASAIGFLGLAGQANAAEKLSSSTPAASNAPVVFEVESTPTPISTASEEFDAVTTTDLNLRDNAGNVVTALMPFTKVHVYRSCGDDRIWVKSEDGYEGSILNRVLPTSGVTICRNDLNLRDENGEILVLIPQGEFVTPLEKIDSKNERTWIQWGDHVGTVLTEGLEVSFVLITIEKQFVVCYQYGEYVIGGLVVTGNESENRGTPRGLFYVMDKVTDTWLTGPTWKAHVDYWMPFAAEGRIGMHNADSWRSHYGGDIYLEGGSHGCVNEPDVVAETIFDTIWVGYPVIVK